MDFVPSFDSLLIAQHARAENDYAIISTYVSPIEDTERALTMNETPLLCMVTFTSTVRNWGTKACRNLVAPKLTNSLWGAGLSFHKVHADLSVPVDPYLDYVFDGEEGSRAVRFWTHGYDVYAPDKVLVTHDYNGHQGKSAVRTWAGNERRQKKAPQKKAPQKEAPQKEEGALTEKGGEWAWRRMERRIEETVEETAERIAVKSTSRVNLLLGIPNLLGSDMGGVTGEMEVEEHRKILRESR